MQCLFNWAAMTGRLHGPIMGVQTLPNSETKPKVDNLTNINLCSYLLSCIPIGLFQLSALIVFKNTTARYVQCGHQTSNLTITIWCSNRLS